MYKVMVVDDEEEFREGVRELIPFEKFGFTLIGEADNGNDALALARDTSPDIVLCDINMPIMDGLEFVEQLALTFPAVKVVFITGYDEFDYAKQAIKLNVYEYMLKPLTPHDVEQLLAKLKNDLDQECRLKQDVEELRLKVKESLPLLRERYLNQWVSGRILPAQLAQRMESVGIVLKGDYWAISLIEVDEHAPSRFASDEELLRFAIVNICEECIQSLGLCGHVFVNAMNQIVVAAAASCVLEKDAKPLMIEAVENIRKSVERYLKITVCIGLGQTVSEGSNVFRSCQGAGRALDYRFLLGGNNVLFIDDLESKNGALVSTAKLNDMLDMLVKQLKVSTAAGARVLLDGYFEEMGQSVANPEMAKVYVIELVTILSKTYFEYLQADNTGCDALHPIIHVSRCGTMRQMKEWVVRWCEEFLLRIASRRENEYEERIRVAIAYMEAHYQENDFSIQQLCEYLHWSVSYFSLLFKRIVGETFVEYLTGLRMEKARELLRTTSLKTYEIAERIGFSNTHYFSLVFKKTVGVAPSEYRSRL